MFVLHTLSGKQVQLEWGTYAMFLYCEKQKIDLKGFGEQVANLQFSLPVMIAMVQCAVVAAGQPEPDIKTVCDWIDDCGGLLAQTGPLQDFANYMLKRTVLTTSEPEEQEKKSPSIV